MKQSGGNVVEEARRAALEVLRHNARGPCDGLPRTAGWGYPEPYTRDWMISALGILSSGDDELIRVVRRVLDALARTQSRNGMISSLAHNPADLGASDTTPLFLIGAACYRRQTGRASYLKSAVGRALTWMRFQSPEDNVLTAQQPTTDWRDEQWVMGYGLYVNTLVHCYLRQYGMHDQADELCRLMTRFDIPRDGRQEYVHNGLAVGDKPYYALWSYKMYGSERFDLLGNCLAVLSGLAPRRRARRIVDWVESECDALRRAGRLALPLPPCFFPYIEPGDPDWRDRYGQFNRPGDYHNGGVWPFVCGFYVAALVAAGRRQLARLRLKQLAELVRPAGERDVAFGFNEWFDAIEGRPRGQDWQTWSAAMYLYAVECVERGETPFFDGIRSAAWDGAAAGSRRT
ncbi:MAG: amylo-alpha-1,6-glucosidase [Phycisphaerales bacterium]|nr:amylo-alpha-1,6-glucosidase [Phycisphaerales bacterium]